MPLPETIPVKYTEEEAEYVSMRPVVRQTFRATELVDMTLSVTGKDLPRIRQVLRSGTVVYHSYRYWWQGFEADPAALGVILATFPNSDPSRSFRVGDCTEAIFESSGSLARHTLRLRRGEASRKRLLRLRSFWDCLMDEALGAVPTYREYSYMLRGDVYSLPLNSAQILRLAQAANQYAPRSLRDQLAILPAISQVAFLCPRQK